MRRATLSAIWLATVLAAYGGVVGYRGDGTCVATNSTLPTRLDVLWRTEMPNWSLSSPIEAGGRVYAMSEPDRQHDFPQLVCLDAQDGRILWQREIEHPVNETTRKAWHEHLDELRAYYRRRYAYAMATNKAEFLARNNQTLDKKGVPESKDGPADVRLSRIFNRGGLFFDGWHLGGLARIGYGYPTPVSDGRRVYVATGLHGFACFEADGTPVWKAWVRGQGSSNAGYGGDDYCKNARSPLLYGNQFISDVGNLVRAFDKETGALLWTNKYTGHEIVAPVVIADHGADILLTATPAAYRLPDGKRLTVNGWKNNGGTMLVKSDERNVVFFTGGGEHGGWEHKGTPPCSNPPPAAVRFTLRGEELNAEVLWSGIEGKTAGECHAGLVYKDGRLYHPGGTILDAATGKVLAGKHRDKHARATPATRHLLWIAGDRVYGLRADKDSGVCETYDLVGRKLAATTLPPPPVSAARREHIVETVGATNWGFSYGCPFTVSGDRLYVRSHSEVLCLGAAALRPMRQTAPRAQ